MPTNKRSGKPGLSRFASKPTAKDSAGAAGRPARKGAKSTIKAGPGRSVKERSEKGVSPPAKAARNAPASAGRPGASGRPRSGGGAVPRNPRPATKTDRAPVVVKPVSREAAGGAPAVKPVAKRPAVAARPAGRRPLGTARPTNIIHTKWKESRAFMPAASLLYKGFFREETLEQAAELLLTGHDPVLQPAVHRVLGEAPIGALHFDLAWENMNRFLYTVEASNRLGGRATLGWMVARNHQEFGAILKAGYEGLCQLHKAAPALASEPLGTGFVYLPDRYRRPGMGRELPVYLFRWPAKEAAPLCVASPSQLSLAAAPRPKLMGRAETERIRFGLAELVVRAFRPAKGVGLNLPALSPDDFLAWRSAGGVSNVNLVFCRAREVRSTPGRYLQRLLSMTWPAPGGVFSWVPEDPAQFFAAVCAAVGEETARLWVAECCGLFAGRGGGSEKGPGAGYVEALRELAASAPEQKEV